MGDLSVGYSVARQKRHQSPVIRPGFGIFSIQRPLNSDSCLREGAGRPVIPSFWYVIAVIFG